MKFPRASFIAFVSLLLSLVVGCAQTVGIAPQGAEEDSNTEADAQITADATPVVDAGQIADASPDVVRLRGHVTVSCASPTEREVLTNTNDYSAGTMTVQTEGRPIEVRHTEARFGWFGTGLDGFVAGEGGNFYFRDFKLRNTATGRIKQGPSTLMLASMSDRRTGTVQFIDPYGIDANSSKTVELLVDVAAHEERYHEITSRYYAFLFGNGRERSIFGTNGIVYTDTGETVPSDEITYDDSCFVAASMVQFQVVPRFADLIADLDREFVRADMTISSGARYTVVPFFVRNEGVELGIFDGTEVVVHARNNGMDFRFADIATACWMTSMAGDVTYGVGTIHDNNITFTHLGVRVPGRDQIPFRVRCSYAWPSDAIGNDIQLRAGAIWNSFTMISLGDMGRIMGTTDLQDNQEFERSDSLMITLHQHD